MKKRIENILKDLELKKLTMKEKEAVTENAESRI